MIDVQSAQHRMYSVRVPHAELSLKLNDPQQRLDARLTDDSEFASQNKKRCFRYRNIAFASFIAPFRNSLNRAPFYNAFIKR